MNVLRTHPLLQVAVGVALVVVIAILAVVAPLGALFATIFGVIYGTVALTAHLYVNEPSNGAPTNRSDAPSTSSMGIL